MVENNQQQLADTPLDQEPEGEVFEVFQQDLQKDPTPHHGGNLRAPDRELAIHYAREFYGRRQESHKLWVIPRTALWEINNPDSDHPDLHYLGRGNALPNEQGHTFAIFVQKQAGKPFTWLQDIEGDQLATVAGSAIQQAKQSEESYLRLWICARNAIQELVNPDLLQPPLDRSYRRLDGYNIREKLRAARQRVQAQGEGSHV